MKKGFRLSFNSISAKILAVVLTSLVLVTVISVAITAFQNNSFANELIGGQIGRAFDNLKADIHELQDTCVSQVGSLAEQLELKQAMRDADQKTLSELLSGSSTEGLDFVVVANNDKAVLSYYEPASANSSEQPIVKDMLTGQLKSGVVTDKDGNIFAVATSAVRDENNKEIGILAGGISYKRIDLLDSLKKVHGVDFTVFYNDVRAATTIIQNGERLVGTKLDPVIADKVINQRLDYAGSAKILGNPYLTAYSPIIDSEGNAVGVLFAGLPMKDIETNRTNTLAISIGATLALIIASVVTLFMFVRRSIRKPLLEMSEGAKKLAAGETDLSINIKRRDEIGVLADAFRNVTQAISLMLKDARMLAEAAVEGKLSARADADKHQGDYRKIVEGVNKTLDAVVGPVQEASSVLEEMSKGNLSASVTGDYKGDHALIKESLNSTIGAIKAYIGEISSVLGEMAQGNMDVGITSEYRGDFVALKDSINGIAGSLNEVLGEIGTAADQVASGTKQVSDGSQEISQGATEQASAIEELTASVTQIAEQTRQNAMSANKASELTASAATNATRGNESMKAMQEAMLQINEASRSISKIIKVIDDIAFQTNILALNAAVEAARAGAHGKGFAVVAEEVRNLAARSAGAAKETTELIEGSMQKTEAGTRIADETANALTAIVQGVDEAAQLVGEIASASNEQASAIAQVNRGIEQMSQVVQTNSATSEEAAAAAEELSSQAEFLKGMVGQFNLANVARGVSSPVIVRTKESAPALSQAKIDLTDGDFGKY